MKKLKLLVIGSGGREHALVWKLAQSPRVEQIFVAPGNAGTAELATNVPIAAADLSALFHFARNNKIDLTIVGPEDPLALGIVDLFQAERLKIFGPGRAAAQLEASKTFAKSFMQEMDIPTAHFGSFTDYDAAMAYLHRQEGQVVVKASGLAAGKGVIVCENREEAAAALSQIMRDKAFGSAGDHVVIEERLTGPELSLLAFSDGRTVIPMLPARDHKRIYNGDQGPNTGGMGAFAPPPDLDSTLIAEITQNALIPVIQGMAERGTPYVGILYAGIMLTPTGPKVLEYNCRFGDPETQVILPMLESDLVEIVLACLERRLTPELVQRQEGACATVVMASPGYPGSYPKGLPISGVEAAAALPHTQVFHAGTRVEGGQLVSSGGRVLSVSAWGDSLDAALERAYTGVQHIQFEGAHYRTDIGRPH
jgi:phosphoribosylamine--glycine ligase